MPLQGYRKDSSRYSETISSPTSSRYCPLCLGRCHDAPGAVRRRLRRIRQDTSPSHHHGETSGGQVAPYWRAPTWQPKRRRCWRPQRKADIYQLFVITFSETGNICWQNTTSLHDLANSWITIRCFVHSAGQFHLPCCSQRNIVI